MVAGVVLGLTFGMLGCSGDSDAGGGGGTGASAGSGETGSGGAGGQSTGDSGGLAGGGQMPECCGVEVSCPPGYSCAGPDLRANRGSCEPTPADAASCWNTYDCPADGICTGQTTCACDDDCSEPNSPGTCEPMGEPCCRDDEECEADEVCVGADGYYKGRCEPLPAEGECFTDVDCATGECVGAERCPCGTNCPTLSGTCTAG